jgi:predicted metal-dependent phosphoesterase TrpH
VKCDLHIHSSISDGEKTIEEIVKMSKEKDISLLSFTEHDSVAGVQNAIYMGKKHNIDIIPGIEISAFDYQNKKKVHILGYNYDLEARHLKKLCKPLLKRRDENSRWQIHQLIQNDYKISLDEVEIKAKASSVIYKQHIMDVLVEKKYTDNLHSNFYKKLFKNDGICSREIIYIDMLDAIDAILLDKGLPVLAHPMQTDSLDLIPKLVNYGLAGVELYHPDHTPLDVELIKNKCKEFKLFFTGGSDYHGKYSKTDTFGKFSIPVDCVKFFKQNLNHK